MSDETRRILELLAQGKITVDEADQLLRAMGTEPRATTSAPPGDRAGERPKPRYLKIAVRRPAGDGAVGKDVTIRVPLGIVRSGIRLGAIIPAFAGEQATARMREQGLDVDFSKLDSAAIDSMLNDFEMDIDSDSGRKTVRISCE
jgi:hypothetical protein